MGWNLRVAAVLTFILAAPRLARAADALTLVEVRLDPPTLHTLGIQLLIDDDDDRDAAVTVRWRAAGESAWRDGPPLFRVLPETFTGLAVPEQFAGSLFDLTPGTTYELELHAADPDGTDVTMSATGVTRPWPRDEPASKRLVQVADADQLRAALAAAQPGDVITLANGTYAGSFFSLSASGTEVDPIVLRGESATGVVIDGEGCDGCNLLEVYGSLVHVERMTFRNGQRAIRFLGATTGNVVRRVVIEDVVHGIGSAPGQSSFTICDNVVHGRLAWPLVYSDDGAAHADDQGIRVDGDGHVVCHNDIAGFGDPMINFAEGGVAYDFYGNEIHEIYGDGTELDRGQRNVRLFGNRFTNLYTAISIQPAHGGPVYVLRNTVVNVADEQIKLKSLGGTLEPSGVLIYHNTFLSPEVALNLQTPITQHNFVIANNLFVGPSPTAWGRTVDWTAAIDRGTFDANGYFPDEGFWFGTVGGTPRSYGSFAEAQAAGVEPRGVLLATPIFDGNVLAPAAYTELLAPADLPPSAASGARDVGLELPGINAGYVGAGPDLGAVEVGCPSRLYGPRPEGMETVTWPVDCAPGVGPGGPDAGPGGDGPDAGPGGGGADGCGCRVASRTPASAWPAALLLLAPLRRRRKW